MNPGAAAIEDVPCPLHGCERLEASVHAGVCKYRSGARCGREARRAGSHAQTRGARRTHAPFRCAFGYGARKTNPPSLSRLHHGAHEDQRPRRFRRRVGRHPYVQRLEFWKGRGLRRTRRALVRGRAARAENAGCYCARDEPGTASAESFSTAAAAVVGCVLRLSSTYIEGIT